MRIVDAPSCAVGRIEPDGPWVGFAPTRDDGYELVVGSAEGDTRRAPATTADLLALAIAYFEDTLSEPPDELAATHGDIGALVRHVAESERDPARRNVLAEAVDGIDDGLAADVVIARLTAALAGDPEPDPGLRLRARTLELLG